MIARDKIGNVFRSQSNSGNGVTAQENTRQRGARVFINELSIRRLGFRVMRETCGFEMGFFYRRQNEMIDPLKKVGAGLIAHSRRELQRKSVLLEKSCEIAAD